MSPSIRRDSLWCLTLTRSSSFGFGFSDTKLVKWGPLWIFLLNLIPWFNALLVETSTVSMVCVFIMYLLFFSMKSMGFLTLPSMLEPCVNCRPSPPALDSKFPGSRRPMKCSNMSFSARRAILEHLWQRRNCLYFNYTLDIQGRFLLIT